LNPSSVIKVYLKRAEKKPIVRPIQIRVENPLFGSRRKTRSKATSIKGNTEKVGERKILVFLRKILSKNKFDNELSNSIFWRNLAKKTNFNPLKSNLNNKQDFFLYFFSVSLDPSSVIKVYLKRAEKKPIVRTI